MRIIKYGLMIGQQRYTLIKESAVNYAADALTTDTQLCQMFNDLYKLNQLAEEHVYLVAFTNKGRPLGVFEVSHGSGSAPPATGSVHAALVGWREFFCNRP